MFYRSRYTRLKQVDQTLRNQILSDNISNKMTTVYKIIFHKGIIELQILLIFLNKKLSFITENDVIFCSQNQKNIYFFNFHLT